MFSRLRAGHGLIIAVACVMTGCANHQEAPANGRAPKGLASPIAFRDVAAAQGISFQWGHGGRSPLTNLETFGCGCAFWDYDQDGWLDILLIGEPKIALFRNLRGKGFKEASAELGLDRHRAIWKGCAVGDIDGDGWNDLVITAYNKILVLHNDKGKHLTDVTGSSGIRPAGWGSSAGFADLDRDGDLDLCFGNYVKFDASEQQFCEMSPGVKSSCPPNVYRAQKAQLYRNDGNGKFTNVTARSGFQDTEGKSLVVGFADYDNDGWTDIYLGNDGTPADLFHNLHNMQFENAGLRAGTAFGSHGGALAAMGIDWGDVDHDQDFDAVVTAFSNEAFALFRNTKGSFNDDGKAAGIADATYKPLGFGTRFVDFDNDGWLDIVFACGHVYDTTQMIDPKTTYLQPLMFFRNLGGWRYEDVSHTAGSDVQKAILGRGLASGDYDRDGRVDLLVVDYSGKPLLLHNESGQAGNWVDISLTGPKGNPQGFGAVINVKVAGESRVFQATPVASYLSSSDPSVHVGLGAAASIEEVEVSWPDGKVSRINNVPIGQRYLVSYESASSPKR